MRRGYQFEIELNRLAQFINSRGGFMHKNHANRTEAGTWLEGEPFDYEILLKGKLYCFDAKECSARRWNLKNAKLNQLNNLLLCEKNGAESFFLVWFKQINKIIKYDAELVKQALIDGKKSLTPEEGAVWQWTELNI